MSLGQKYEEKLQKFSFLARHFKVDYIVILISLSLVNICQNYIGLYCVPRSSMHCYSGERPT